MTASLLAYCVMRAGGGWETQHATGVEGASVTLVETADLCAAVSRHDFIKTSATEADALAYAGVVNAFFRQGAIIPLRYGNIFHESLDLIRLLQDRHDRYLAILSELDDCVEMGIRIIPADGGMTSAVSPPEKPTDRAASTGRSYLMERKAHYAMIDELPAGHEAIARKIRHHFDGLFVKSRIESAQPHGGNLISLYFLVPNGNVERFRSAFRTLSASEQAKLLLSGPWPPYNMVFLENA
ncbi:MAG: GvpL/GvpF family gas vesicle protein [Candidatus Sumerlaeota bacterium]|nr:GvpL/GvpF family gas vesicle protein [Candidatus Sumerlaeota bacterium]